MKLGDQYYFITDKGTVGKSIWFGDNKDNFRARKNIVFKKYYQVKNALSIII